MIKIGDKVFVPLGKSYRLVKCKILAIGPGGWYVEHEDGPYPGRKETIPPVMAAPFVDDDYEGPSGTT